MKSAVLDALVTARAAKQPAALLTDLGSGDQALWLADGSPLPGDFPVTAPLLEAVAGALRADKGQTVADGDRQVFIQVFNPPLRLMIVGAVHIAQPLSLMARQTGYDVTVIDPRGHFASPDRFPDIALSQDWPDEALETLKPDARTAVVCLTHDPKLDDPALELVLNSPAFYVAALGSRRTHAARRDRLAEAGLGPDQIDRIHGPAGLAIGAVSPAEIAVSVMAQMTAVLHAATP